MTEIHTTRKDGMRPSGEDLICQKKILYLSKETEWSAPPLANKCFIKFLSQPTRKNHGGRSNEQHTYWIDQNKIMFTLCRKIPEIQEKDHYLIIIL